MSSDNVALLSYTSNILAGVTITTEKVILGQYISVNALPKSDREISVVFQFSGDGANWDYSITNNIPTGSNLVLSTPVVAKWLRLQITNLDLTDTTSLRVYVYGAPSNSAISATIGKVGNEFPFLNVANTYRGPYGEVLAGAPKSKRSYIFTKGTTGSLDTSSWVLPYPGFFTFGHIGATLEFSNGDMSINGLTPAPGNGPVAFLCGPAVTVAAGAGMSCRFTAYYTQGLKNPSFPGAATELVGMGNGTFPTGEMDNFVGFGYGDGSLPADDLNSFGVVVIRDRVKTFVPRTSWNTDKSDGNNIMPALDFSKYQCYEVQMQFASGVMNFNILNPNTGLFLTVHQWRFSNNTNETSILEPSLGIMAYAEFEPTSIPLQTTDSITLGDFAIVTDVEEIKTDLRVAASNTVAGVTVERNIISLSNNPSWYGSLTRRAVDIDFISAAHDTQQTVLISIYRNSPLTNPVWVEPYPDNIPVSVDRVGVHGPGGFLVFSFVLGRRSSTQLDLSDYHLHLNTSDTLTVTATSAVASTPIISLGFYSH
jgi:hypothetical protein